MVRPEETNREKHETLEKSFVHFVFFVANYSWIY